MSQRIFVTGATGYLGSAIAARLARAGHEVLGLTRQERRAEKLERAGITPIVGDLAQPDTYLGKLKNCDVAVHAAYDSEAGPASVDQRALESMRAAVIDGRLRRLLYTSGTWVHGDTGGEVIDESTPLNPLPYVKWRAAHEEITRDYAEHGLQTVILRPTIVYGESRGIFGKWWRDAKARGVFKYPGDGSQHWSLVHRDDVAEAFHLALEHAKPGDCFVLTDGSLHTVESLAEAVARVTGAEPRPWPREQVIEQEDEYGQALLTDLRVSAAKARRELGWVPRHTSFVAEAEALYAEWQSGLKTTVN